MTMPKWLDAIPEVDEDRLWAIRERRRRMMNDDDDIRGRLGQDFSDLFAALDRERKRTEALAELLDAVSACAVCMCGQEDGPREECPVCWWERTRCGE
jgi:hypothetical protein